MKKLIAGLLTGCLCWMLAACSILPEPIRPTHPPEPSETEEVTVPEETMEEATEETVEMTEATVPESTGGISPTEPLSNNTSKVYSRFPYIISVNDPNKPIYSGPGYDYSYEGTVEVAALYTIMEERTDAYGNVWGRLKSGAGWIVLNEYFTPYLIYVSNPDKPIYSGPGYDYSYEGTVEVAAQYTIVQEQYDSQGNLWGRLKSGAGWISLSEKPISRTPYLEEICWSEEPIYSGPGYGYSYVGTVEEAGVYTIVEEKYDGAGDLWGRLKSGVGWVNLSHIRYG